MSESKIQQDIQIQARYYDTHLMRNNSGALNDEFGRPVRFGLGNVSKEHNKVTKSSDLIGVTSVIVTPDMVGKRVAIFTAIEVKKPNWKWSGDEREVAQKNFIDWIISLGGIAGFANSIDTLKMILRK